MSPVSLPRRGRDRDNRRAKSTKRMKPRQIELALPNDDTRQVVVYGSELPDAIARLKADGFTVTVMEHISNAGYRLTAYRTITAGPDLDGSRSSRAEGKAVNVAQGATRQTTLEDSYAWDSRIAGTDRRQSLTEPFFYDPDRTTRNQRPTTIKYETQN